MNLLINVTELSCYFAENDLHENWKDEFENGVEGMYETKENGDRVYVEKAQDIFNDLVDHYEDIIRSSQVALPDKSHSDSMDEERLKTELQWWRDYGYYVANKHNNVDAEACGYADGDNEYLKS